jgi:aerobic carbon-monoxide dehydrogenase large subunit
MDDFVDPMLLDLDRFAIGQPVPRSEDPVLVSGKGQFTDDVNLAGQAYAVIVRSTYAHGVIREIDTAAARGVPGVLGVYTAADLAAAGSGSPACAARSASCGMAGSASSFRAI